MLNDRPLTEVIDAFAAPGPTPGGGSAAALAGAVGAALLAMVAGLPRNRAVTAEDRQRLEATHREVEELKSALRALVDRDTAAYDAVMAALRLPKASDEERLIRGHAIQAATHEAIASPLEIMRHAVAGLERATTIATLGSVSAASDVGVAVALLEAALRGARLNVDANLPGIKDRAYMDGVRAEAVRLLADGEAHATGARVSAGG